MRVGRAVLDNIKSMINTIKTTEKMNKNPTIHTKYKSIMSTIGMVVIGTPTKDDHQNASDEAVCSVLRNSMRKQLFPDFCNGTVYRLFKKNRRKKGKN